MTDNSKLIAALRLTRHIGKRYYSLDEVVVQHYSLDDVVKIMAQAADEIERLNTELAAVRGALTRSVSLQSHYAGLLNDYDGGRRLQFADAKAWLDRLNSLSPTSETKGT